MKVRILCFLLILSSVPSWIHAQKLTGGNVIYRAKNVHAGNMIRITFHNNGRLGSVRGDQSVTYTGEWPIGSGKVQLGNTSVYVTTEQRVFTGINPATGDSTYTYLNPVEFSEGWDPNAFSRDSLGVFQGFEPLPGYYNPTQKEKDPAHAAAMSHQPFTWPPFWPDKTDDPKDPGWSAHWNGYFGKDQYNADQESYYVVDDYQFKKRLKGLALPPPIKSEPNRGGLGLKMYVRGLQWSNPDAEDALFWLYDIHNFGELRLDKTMFGINVGSSNGNLLGSSGIDNSDDGAQFYREKAFAVNFDQNNIGVGGYTPVPWVGFAYLESPGNPYDGIDNDGDGGTPKTPGGGTGRMITELGDFYKFYDVGSKIVLIDYESPRYERRVMIMPPEGVKFTVKGVTYTMKPNTPLIEIPHNGIDDNLNGLIDESDGTTTQDSVKYFLYVRSEANKQDYLAKDYVTGAGFNNQLIDERRDDGLDNDGDWDGQTDDVGIDGKPATGDYGEGDGKATSGYIPPEGRDSGLPGEPSIDKTDVHESDQIGLTSFKFYRYGSLTYSNDDQMFQFSQPGYFDKKTVDVGDYDYVFASGFFPLMPGEREFFSVALVYGWDEEQILRNKDVVQKIYNANYNFATAPTKPIVTAVAGDRQVTLYWDDGAEKSFDRYLKEFNFEGYKIYKSTYYTFTDAGDITDGFGYGRFKKPIAIYDKIDSVFGFFPRDFGKGVLFNLGNETGLVHTYVDRDVKNGVRYFYAVTAYSPGNLAKNIGPTETTIYVNADATGKIQFGENVVAVTPQAPSAGYRTAGFDIAPKLVGEGLTRGVVGVNIVDPGLVKEGEEYEIQFLDQSMDHRDNNLNGLVDKADPSELLPTVTTGFVLKSLMRGMNDTTWIYDYGKQDSVYVAVQNLYNDNDGDPRTLTRMVGPFSIYVKNPVAGVYQDTTRGIVQGIRWGNKVNYRTAYTVLLSPFSLGGFKAGIAYPRQYKVVFSSSIVDTSDQVGLPLATTPASIQVPRVPVNFKVYDMQTGMAVRFAFADQSKNGTSLTPAGYFSAKDRIIFYERLPNDSAVITWSLTNETNEDTTFYAAYHRIVGAGDTLYVYTDNPFTGNVRYRFKVRGEAVDNEAASRSMTNIRVVPNPYVVTAMWEPRNPYTSGRGPRAVQFINLPQQSTIRIYSVDGTLVRMLEHNASMSDGSETWDLMSKENMAVAYGVYIYHVDAPGVGEHIGKIFVIK